jgi:hypothetical protein
MFSGRITVLIFTVLCLLAGLTALWSNDYSTPAKKLKMRGFDPNPLGGISQGAQNGPVVGCLTMDLAVG